MERVVFIKNEQKALPMEKYMKNKFVFACLPKPVRAKAQLPVLKSSKSWLLSELLEEIGWYYAQPEREYQYLAIELVQMNIKRLTLNELHKIILLVKQKQWWDSIDSWRKVFSTWLLVYPQYQDEVYALFEKQEDFWLRRIFITIQLQYKNQTETDVLKRAILYDRTTDEFFIQKAIGWALRDYAKSNPTWVRNFLAETQLSPLAIREASKYL